MPFCVHFASIMVSLGPKSAKVPYVHEFSGRMLKHCRLESLDRWSWHIIQEFLFAPEYDGLGFD